MGSVWLNFSNVDARTRYTIAYGGDFRPSRNILLNFAPRTQFTDHLKMDRLISLVIR